MKENNANVKSQKKITKKRKFFSAPNLPLSELRAKGTDAFLVTPDEIRKYKKDLLADVADKQKKAKKKAQTKKINEKNVDKILLEPSKVTSNSNKKGNEDFQWLIKKNIVKVMSAAKKTNKEEVAGTNETKIKRASVAIKKNKSEGGKKAKGEQTKNPTKNANQTRKSPTRKNNDLLDIQQKILRPNSANLPLISKQRATPHVLHEAEYFNRPLGKAAMILHPTASVRHDKKPKMNTLKDAFGVFKAKEEAARNSATFKGGFQELLQKIEALEKKATGGIQNKKLIGKQIKPKALDPNVPKPKNKKQQDPNANAKPSPKPDQTSTSFNKPPANKNAEPKKRKRSTRKQLQTVSA